MSLSNAQLRSNTLETLGLLAERFPQLRLMQIIGNAVGSGDPYYITDEQLALALNQLFVTYSQFQAAGMKP